MAYRLRWFNEFKEVGGDLVRVEVLHRDYAGPVSEVKKAGDRPIVISLAKDATSDPFDPIRPTKATVEWIADEESNFNIQNLFITDDQEFKLVLKINSIVKWTGFVILSDCQEPYLSKPYKVSFQATCGLAFLDRYEVLDVDGKYIYFLFALNKALQGAFSKVGHGFDIEDATNLLCTQTTETFFGPYKSLIQGGQAHGDGTRGMNCMSFLAGVLNAANSFIVQSNGKWTIQSNRVLTSPEFDRILFNQTFDVLSEGKVNKTVELISPEDLPGNNYPANSLRPTPSVIEKLAQPKSKIQVNVSPGVQHNRLLNGSFVPIGGLIPGWDIVNMVPIASFESIGAGTPDDPYMLYYKSFLGSSPSMQRIVPNLVELNIGDVQADNASEFNIKVRVSGTIKAENLTGLQMVLRVNYGERDWVDYMLSDGAWDQRKPSKSGEARFSVITPVKAGFFTKDEIDSSTFDMESKPIQNWINRSGNWIAKVGLRIDKIMSGVSGRPPSIWLQDFAITIDTGTAYEGDHRYEIDASKVILNGEGYDYDISIADKINIDTLEQKRELNRVMTGYLSLGNTLTNSWVRIVDGVADPLDSTPKPIQHLSIKERIRLLCGKRSILEGTFLGKGLWPDSRIVNTIEEGRKPMMVTDWEWNVKDNQYRASFFELDFTPLSNEEVLLVEEDSGGGGRRTRAGGGGTSTGTLPATKPIIVDDLPTLSGVIKKGIVYEQDIEEFLISYPDIETIQIRVLSKPSWANVVIDALVVTVTGTPDKSGDDQLLIEAFDGSGDEYTIVIPIQIFPVTIVSYTINPGGAVIPGLPRQTPYAPPYSASILVKGGHDRYQFTFKGGGGEVDVDSGQVEVGYTENATYYPVTAETIPEGIYDIGVVLWRNIGTTEDPIWTETHRSSGIRIIGENIGEDDPERNIVATLEPIGSVITSAGLIVDNLPEINIGLSPIGIEHDRLFVSITPEEDPFYVELFPETTDVTGSITNQIINQTTGVATDNSGWYATSKIVEEGERYWSDGGYFLYNGATFVSYHPDGELVIPAGVDTMRTNKESSAPYVRLVQFDNYELFPVLTEKKPGSYNLFIRAFKNDLQTYEKFGKFTILEPEIIEPETEAGLILVRTGTPFEQIGALPLLGGIFPLPDKWNILCPDFGGKEFDQVNWTIEQDNGGWQQLNLGLYGVSTNKTFPGGEINANLMAFGSKNSTLVGSGVHIAPSRFRVTFDAKSEGEKIATRQSDFMFRPNVPLGPESGLDYKYVYLDSESTVDIEDNIPETGGYYKFDKDITESGGVWVLKTDTLDGVTLFNEVIIRVNGNIVDHYTTGIARPTIDAMFSEYLDWDRTGLDQAGMYAVSYDFRNGGVSVGEKSAAITLFDYEENPPIKDPNECCSDGGDENEWSGEAW